MGEPGGTVYRHGGALVPKCPATGFLKTPDLGLAHLRDFLATPVAPRLHDVPGASPAAQQCLDDMLALGEDLVGACRRRQQ